MSHRPCVIRLPFFRRASRFECGVEYQICTVRNRFHVWKTNPHQSFHICQTLGRNTKANGKKPLVNLSSITQNEVNTKGRSLSDGSTVKQKFMETRRRKFEWETVNTGPCSRTHEDHTVRVCNGRRKPAFRRTTWHVAQSCNIQERATWRDFAWGPVV